MKERRKQGYSAIEKHPHGLENPVDKIKRWKRNIAFACQRVRYGYCERDVWSIDWWFLNVVPNMLQELKETKHGYPDALSTSDHNSQRLITDEAEKEEEGSKKWDAILSEMIFLFREANEETCRKKNPYEEQYEKCSDEFIKKYGFFGEKLKTKEEMEEEKEKRYKRWYTLGDVPEYQNIQNKYLKEEQKIDQYRNECKNKGLELFSKWFWSLWD